MAWRIPEERLEAVKRSTDLVALARSRGIELKRHGSKDWIGRCPFHADRDTPNFIVTPDKGLFHCMACGKAGNAIQFVQEHDGVSFRHAYELLHNGQAFKGAGRSSHQGPLKTATVPRLECPLDVEADDPTLWSQVMGYYHERLKDSATSGQARAYLASRGLDSGEMIERFQIGFADRTLGLRLPGTNRKEGERLRSRLIQLGLWRESGHEHFNGCVVVPFQDEAGRVVSLYGRRLNSNGRSGLRHLYPPGPHRGLFNREAFESQEIILCEAVFDALTFWLAGFRNVSCLFGTEGFTDELWEAMKRVRCVRIAYDGDEAGERAALRDAARFQASGIEVYRIKFPHGMDANEYAQKLQPAAKSLALLVNSSQWQGAGARPPKPAPNAASPRSVDAPASSSLAASLLAADTGKATKEKSSPKPEPVNGANVDAGHDIEEPAAAPTRSAASTSTPVMQPPDGEPLPPAPLASTSTRRASEAAVHGVPAMEQRGDAFFFHVDEREYRVGGLEKTIGTDALKITLRLRYGERFHLDQIDLCRDAERRRFMDRAAEETGLTVDLLKRDLGKLLLAVEQTQSELAKPMEEAARTVTLSPEEREAALAWLTAPNLIERLRQAFHQAGIIGEETNTLIAYLAGVSRKLEHPLAIIIQSASAAGKTTLMDAVLSFFPEEERLKYSAMTGQSLYYLGETNLQHKILAVVEEAGAERASYALKLLQSEGELTIASTGKDPQSGKMVTQEYHVEGPVMIFLTTTAIDLDEELQNRCLTLTVDESAEQTGRIHRLQRERRTLAGLVAREERQELLKTLRNAQRLLATVAVVNPYAPALTFPTGRTRNRRDHEKYLGLIDAIALLHQYQREKKSLPVGPAGAASACFIEVTLDDIALANELVPEVLSRSLDELPPQTRRLLDHIRDLLNQRRAATKAKVGPGSAKVGAGFACFSRKELREHCQWSLTQLRVHLDRLVELEYLGLRQGRLGHRFVYEILVDLDAPENVAHVGLIDVERLRTHDYDSGVTGFERGVAGLKAGVTGGGQTAPPPLAPLQARDLRAG